MPAKPSQPIPPASGYAVGETIYSPEFCQLALASIGRNPKAFEDRASNLYPRWAIKRALSAWGFPT